jgi:hypothetical protein
LSATRAQLPLLYQHREARRSNLISSSLRDIFGGTIDLIIGLPGETNISGCLRWQDIAPFADLRINLGIKMFPKFNCANLTRWKMPSQVVRRARFCARNNSFF